MKIGNPLNSAVSAICVMVFMLAQWCCSSGIAQEINSGGNLIKIATFDVDATPPVGSDMAYDSVKRIGELSLRCRGLVILGAGKPIVLCAVDWIGIANEGHDAFRLALANAAGTTPKRVAVHSLHQHDAPGCDFTAERILRELGKGKFGRFDGTFHRVAIDRAAAALRASLPLAKTATHYGWGVADVEKVASNRRILGADGRVRAVRFTTTKDPALRAEPEGVIDPQVSIFSFWNQEQPIALLSYYACHPQSYYRTGVPSPDFPGIARFVRGQSIPQALLIHFNGAGGNIGAGKYNDGAKENRMKLALRLADGMKRAYDATQKQPLAAETVVWQTTPVRLSAAKHLDRKTLTEEVKANPIGGYIDKSDQLAWLQRCDEGHAIDVSCLSVGDARVLHLPGELFVEYQLAAKAMRSDLKVAMAAYGDYGPGYIGTKIAYSEGGYETSSRASNVTPDAEKILMDAIGKLLEKKQNLDLPKPNGSDPNRMQQQSSDQNSLDRSQLGQPLSPQQALESFEVLPGFEMQLVANEPNVQEPIVISYDEDGRMYVAEYLKFPAKAGKSDGPDGRIRLLTDHDADGHYENSSVFADGLAWPTGICPWKGGVFVIAAPDLWYLKDSNGDGKADVRTKILTGFGFSNEEGTANNLIWGLDHWIYGAGSNSGGEIRPTDQPLARPVSIRNSDFRFHPATGKFESITGSEQFGNSFDDWGNRFICQNSKPAVHVVLPAHYLARNPYLPVSNVLKDIWKGDAVYRISTPENWRVDRTTYRKLQDRHWAPAFVEHDVFTACTGVTIYRGQIYPAEFRGNLFVGDVQSNLVHRRILKSEGASFRSLRADRDTEVIRSTDNWFRPVNFCNAPDGTLHVVDMYREVIETPDSLPDEILASVDLSSGQERGRIYRLAPIGFKAPALPQFSSASVEQLVDELKSQNGWRRVTASRLLNERKDKSAVDPLRKMLRESNSKVTQLHALYALSGLGELQTTDIKIGLASTSPRLREHAVRLAETIVGFHRSQAELESEQEKLQNASANDLINQVLALADDPTSRVRFQVALTLGQFDDTRVAGALAKIAKQDATDEWIRTAVLSSSLNHAAEILNSLLADSEFRKTVSANKIFEQLAVIVGGRNRTDEIRGILELIDNHSGPESGNVGQTVVLGIGEGLRRSRSSLSDHVRESTPTADMISRLVKQALQALNSRSSTTKQRVDAIRLLVHGDWEEVNDGLVSSLTSRQAPAVQLAAVQGMASFSSHHVPDALIGKWNALSPSVRGEVIETLLSRVDWTSSVLDAIEDKTIPQGSITPLRKSQLLKHSDHSIRLQAANLFDAVSQTSLETALSKLRPALSLTGDAKRGEIIFQKNCMGCHQAGGNGQNVGPDLATVKNQSAESLLVEIVDPNREIQANFTQYLVLLDDGRSVSGMIAGESPGSITLQRAEGVRETVLRQNIDEIRGSGKSLMPESLEQNISLQEMSDLITFLKNL
ncbi:MAG: putative membrane-bound dehydrogenase-like protein [Mariniblastus sp.]|jgi:putative membrane-bound dehydrogenase-like protein